MVGTQVGRQAQSSNFRSFFFAAKEIIWKLLGGRHAAVVVYIRFFLEAKKILCKFLKYLKWADRDEYGTRGRHKDTPWSTTTTKLN